MILEFEVILKDVGVPVSRTVQIHSNKTFYDLHLLIQAAFDWTNSHLHEFLVHRTDGQVVEQIEITPKEDDELGFYSIDGSEGYLEHEERLVNWFQKTQDKVMYTYDFGDNWEHEIVLLKKREVEDGVSYPRCTKACNYAPPEDSRLEIIMGEIELECPNNSELIREINEDITELLDYQIDDNKYDLAVDYWPETLEKAKEFQQLKPWENMLDEHIFAIFDPVTETYLFCSVIGNAGEMHGLAIYRGMDGFFALINTLTSASNEFEILQRQHSLLVSFEDRTDLDKAEYNLIKTYDIPFRGKKAWPSFVSFIPGYYPWLMDNEEAGIALLALQETIDIYEQFINGLQLPDLIKDEKILVRVQENGVFQNSIMDLSGIFADENEVDLTISELELKRVSKIKKPLPVTIEFTLTYVNMPIEAREGERPIFPLTVIVADHNEDIILHHELYEQALDAEISQREFINVLHNLNGRPSTIFTDERTYYYISPLIEKLDIHVEIVDHLPVVNILLKGLQGYISSQ